MALLLSRNDSSRVGVSVRSTSEAVALEWVTNNQVQK